MAGMFSLLSQLAYSCGNSLKIYSAKHWAVPDQINSFDRGKGLSLDQRVGFYPTSPLALKQITAAPSLLCFSLGLGCAITRALFCLVMKWQKRSQRRRQRRRQMRRQMRSRRQRQKTPTWLMRRAFYKFHLKS